MSEVTLGHVTLGSGSRRVLVLHDWMGDHHNWDPVRPYLDGAAATWVFADLRGYGLSRGIAGRHDLEEASQDVLALADHLGWDTFDLVGHSMSSLVAQQVAASGRVHRLVLVGPIAPSGMGTPEPVIQWLEGVAADPSVRAEALGVLASRLGTVWRDVKLRRWAESADPQAARDYVGMFSTQAVTTLAQVPVLAVVGQHDAEPFTPETVPRSLAGYADLSIQVIASAGHYPMEETPPALAGLIQAFLG